MSITEGGNLLITLLLTDKRKRELRRLAQMMDLLKTVQHPMKRRGTK